MPFRDGSGPIGDGRPGRGLGLCGLGRRNGGFGMGGGYRWRALSPGGASQDQAGLARRVSELQAELDELRGRLANAPPAVQE